MRSDFPVAAGANEIQPAWPEDVAVDSTKLVALSEWIRKERLDVRSFLVVKDDKLIFERYGDDLSRDYNYELYSITKMMTSLLAGQLIADGKVHLNDSIAPILSNWRPDLKTALADKQDIELRHVHDHVLGPALHLPAAKRSDLLHGARSAEAGGGNPAIPEARHRLQYMDINPILAAATLSAAAGEPLEQIRSGTPVQADGADARRLDSCGPDGAGVLRLGLAAARHRHGQDRAARAGRWQI